MQYKKNYSCLKKRLTLILQFMLLKKQKLYFNYLADFL